MKILMDARALGSKPSGIGWCLNNILIELLKFEEFDIHLITDVATSKEILELERLGSKIHLYGKEVNKSISLYSYYRFVQMCIHREKPDVFWEGNNLVPIKMRNPYGRMLVTIYDMFPLTVPEYYGKLYSKYFRYGIAKTVKYFDTLIYISNHTKEETEQFFPKAKDKKSFVGYIIIPRLPELPITDNGAFLYIGNLEMRKGTDILLRSYIAYRKNGGNRPLRLAGKIREEGIQQLLDQACREVEGITYLGYVTEEERNKEYASCGCFLFPSRAEGFGMPVVEAMHYGKPIIVGELPIYKEIVGDTIQYFDLGDDEVENLVKKMRQMRSEDKQELYREVVIKYSNERVAKGFVEMLTKEDVV